MEHLVFNQDKMEFRYGSGATVYSEKFLDGRLLCTDYHASGMPQYEGDRIADNPVTAFNLVVDGKDASYGWDFVTWNENTASDGRPFAEMILKNTALALQLRIITYCGDNGYFSRKMYLTNLSAKAISLTSVSPLAGVLWEINEDITEPLKDGDIIPYSVGGFLDNWWGNEGNFGWRDVPYNTTVEFGSNTGRSGHNHPFAIVHNHIMGGYFVCQLEWSGNWAFRFHNDFRFIAAGLNQKCPYIRLCFELGPTAKAPMRILDPQEELALPPIHFGYTYKNLDGAIQELQDYQRKYILARAPLGYDLINFNYAGFQGLDIKENVVRWQVDNAALLGCEMFVVDAGWYGKPDTFWSTTTGDWEIDRLPCGLKSIVDYAHEKGLRFGLWIEPESVGIDSELLKEHPEWLMNRYGQSVERSLDLARPEVEKWVENQLVSVIERYGVDMIRLDYNNIFLYEGGFNSRGEFMENTHWRHVEAIHRIFDNIREQFPDVILENCASGGGRTDLGMLSRFSKTQFSDWHKLPKVARIFNGMSMCLPPERLMTFCGAVDGGQRYGHMETQLQFAVQCVPQFVGVAPYPEKRNPAYVKRVQEYIKLYKEFIRPIQIECRMYHHTPVVPGFMGRGWVVYENVSQDSTKAYATFFRLPGTDQDTWLFKTKGLDTSKEYKITFFDGARTMYASGYELYTNGIPIYLDSPLTSQLLLIEARV